MKNLKQHLYSIFVTMLLVSTLFISSTPAPGSGLETWTALRKENQILKEQYLELQCNLEDYKEVFDSKIAPLFETNSIHNEKYQYMKQKLQCPEASLALAALECGHFQSSFYKMSNNMFSMGLSNRPYDFKAFNTGDGNFKAGFNDWKKSIDDMALWEQDKITRGLIDTTSNEAYIKSLKRCGYAEDPNHEFAVLSTYRQLFADWKKID